MILTGVKQYFPVTCFVWSLSCSFFLFLSISLFSPTLYFFQCNSDAVSEHGHRNLFYVSQAIGVEERWQEAATALGPADRQAKFLRLLGAKKGTTAAAVAAGASATGETDSAQPSASSSSSALRNEGGGQAANAKARLYFY